MICTIVDQEKDKKKERNMSRKQKSFVWFGAGLSALLIVILAISCGNKGPTASDNQQDLAITTEMLDIIMSRPAGDPPPMIVQNSSSLITKESGGELLLPAFGRNTGLFVAPHSTKRNILITVTAELWNASGKNIATFDFWPEGIVFDRPARLVIDGRHFSGSTELTLLWYDGRGKRWEYQATGEIKNGVAEFEIHHFSKYAISD
jgi:hypothetical protein